MHLKLYVHIPIPARPGVNAINAQHDIREIHFNPSTVVRDALEQIRTQYNLPDDTEHTSYGLFMMNDDNGQFTDEDRYEKGWWLNDESPLDNYLLKAEDNILIKESDLTFILTYNMIQFMVIRVSNQDPSVAQTHLML